MDTRQRPLLLMLGADRYALQACVRHGIDGVVICGPAIFDDGLIEFDPSITVLKVDDQRNPEAILGALNRAGLGSRTFDGLQTTDEWAMVTASLVARYLGCDFLDPAVAIRFRDKSLQKAAVASSGVRVTNVTVIEDIYDVSAFTELPYERCVLKPVAGAATARTSVITSVDELRRRSMEYRDQRISQRTFVLEDFVSGDEWLADGIMYDGQLEFVALARYGAPCLTTVATGQPLMTRRFDPEDDHWAYELAGPIVERALAALGLRSGVFHMELFHDADAGQLTFSECAARRGGVLVHEELQAKFNVNLAESAVFCALGTRPDLTVKRDPRVIGGSFLTGRPGTLAECPSPAEVAARPGVLFARIERPYGTVIERDLASTNQRLGQFLAAGESDAELASCVHQTQEWFTASTKAIPLGATRRELRAWQRAASPAADFGDTLW